MTSYSLNSIPSTCFSNGFSQNILQTGKVFYSSLVSSGRYVESSAIGPTGLSPSSPLARRRGMRRIIRVETISIRHARVLGTSLKFHRHTRDTRGLLNYSFNCLFLAWLQVGLLGFELGSDLDLLFSGAILLCPPTSLRRGLHPWRIFVDHRKSCLSIPCDHSGIPSLLLPRLEPMAGPGA